jgi:hypothetical protein
MATPKWVAVYAVESSQGAVSGVVVERRQVNPRDSEWTASVGWRRKSGSYAEVRQILGAGDSLTTRLLRRMSPPRAASEARAIITDPRIREGMEDWLGADWAALADRAIARGSTGPARKRARLARLAAVAARYVAAQERGERAPVAVVAGELGLRQEQVRDRLYKARNTNPPLLTETPGRGRSGGRLTKAAIELLQEDTP